ncbi:MAG: hypothetical protein M1840_005800 [Geoglossum simile]|nr:MAG: hypothetical protein M1840_005800 [Geoglossum simile]
MFKENWIQRSNLMHRMIMHASAPRQSRSICQLCMFISRKSAPNLPLKHYTTFAPGRVFSVPRATQPSRLASTKQRKSAGASQSSPRNVVPPPTSPRTQVGYNPTELQRVKEMIDSLLSFKEIPSEEHVLHVLRPCEGLARELVASPTGSKYGTAASALLSLEDDSARPILQAQKAPYPPTNQAIDALSNYVYLLLLHPPIFISLDILTTYVNIQTILAKPETFPEIFKLYATKPIPKVKPSGPSTEIKYTLQNPNKAAFAIPLPLANTALECALSHKSLVTSLAIIDTTVAAPSFRRAKFIRRALPPLTGFSLAPVAAYTLASKLSEYQSSMDPAMATNVAFAGILAYVTFTATLGLVAVTTANDQMDRVTWASGMPLRERWIREEERAAVDKVAQAWGFKETFRRGEEEGVEWEALREWVGLRGMVLDKIELMEGME